MFFQDSEEALFLDVATCFSDDDWKMLQNWQKELYKNVMREIHQALISLGPLITTTVFSLRKKDKQELCSTKSHESERHDISFCPSDMSASPVESFNIKYEEDLQLSNSPITEGTEQNDCPNADQDITTVLIKEEEDIYCVDDQPHDSSRNERASNHTGETDLLTEPGEEKKTGKETRSRKRKHLYYAAGTEKTVREDCTGNHKSKVFRKTENRTHSKSHLNTGRIESSETTAQSEIAYMHSEHSSFQQGTSSNEQSVKYNNSKGKLWDSSLCAFLPDAQINIRPFACSQCEKAFRTRKLLSQHHQIHLGGRPFHCTGCEKSFRLKHHLIQHQRTHTGERPYHCTKCEKSFSLNGTLRRHMRLHKGVVETTLP